MCCADGTIAYAGRAGATTRPYISHQGHRRRRHWCRSVPASATNTTVAAAAAVATLGGVLRRPGSALIGGAERASSLPFWPLPWSLQKAYPFPCQMGLTSRRLLKVRFSPCVVVYLCLTHPPSCSFYHAPCSRLYTSAVFSLSLFMPPRSPSPCEYSHTRSHTQPHFLSPPPLSLSASHRRSTTYTTLPVRCPA